MPTFAFLRARWTVSAGANVAAALAVALLGLVSIAVLAREVPLALFGAINLAVLIMNSLTAFDGIRPVIILQYAPEAEPGDDLFRSAMAYSAMVGAVIGVGAALVAQASFGFSAGDATILGIACLVHFPTSAVASFLDAHAETLFTGITRSLGWCLLYLAFVATAYLNGALEAYLGILIVFQLVLLGAYTVRLARLRKVSMGLGRVHRARVWHLATESANMIGFNLAALVLGLADRLAVNFLLGLRSYGLYSGPYDFAVRPTALFRVVAMVSLPEFVQRRPLKLIGKWWLLLLATFGATALAALVAMSWSEELIVLALGETFRPSAIAFGVLVAALPFFAVSYFGAVLCQATGQLALQRKVFSWGAAVFCVILVPMVLQGGLAGAALAVLLSRLVDVVLVAALLDRLDIRLPLRRCVAALMLYGAAVHLALIGQLLAAAALGATLCATLLWLRGALNRGGMNAQDNSRLWKGAGNA